MTTKRSKRYEMALNSAPICEGAYERRASDIITRQVFRNGKVVYERLEQTYQPHQETATMGSLIDFDALAEMDRQEQEQENKKQKGTQQ